MAARAGLAVSATVRKCTNLERLHRSGLSHDSGIGRVSLLGAECIDVWSFARGLRSSSVRYKSRCSRSEGVGLEMWNGGSWEAGKGWQCADVSDLGGGADSDKH